MEEVITNLKMATKESFTSKLVGDNGSQKEMYDFIRGFFIEQRRNCARYDVEQLALMCNYIEDLRIMFDKLNSHLRGEILAYMRYSHLNKTRINKVDFIVDDYSEKYTDEEVLKELLPDTYDFERVIKYRNITKLRIITPQSRKQLNKSLAL